MRIVRTLLATFTVLLMFGAITRFADAAQVGVKSFVDS
jgi:hypothetical protein